MHCERYTLWIGTHDGHKDFCSYEKYTVTFIVAFVKTFKLRDSIVFYLAERFMSKIQNWLLANPVNDCYKKLDSWLNLWNKWSKKHN